MKTQQPVLLAEARRIHQKLIQEKTAKGYTTGEDGAPYQNTDKANQTTGIQCQLLNPINAEEVEHYLDSPDYWLQEKHDGRRLLIQKSGDEIIGINRKGLIIPLPGALMEDVRECGMDFIMDGESVGNVLYAFDLLSVGGDDIRNQPFNVRHHLLADFTLALEPRYIYFSQTAQREEDKRWMFHHLMRKQREGIVFKDINAPYSAGRPASGGTQLKHKFYETASFVVGKINAKRSVGLRLEQDGHLVDAGNVTIPSNHEIPETGSIVECRYLYAFPESGVVYQPTYLGVRDDLTSADCSSDQLKMKPDSA